MSLLSLEPVGGPEVGVGEVPAVGFGTIDTSLLPNIELKILIKNCIIPTEN